ncbi:MAG: UDP-glucose dehydrogenase family protein [bacterium]
MKITVIGMGYVGVVTSACIAEMGNQVWGVDVDEKKVEKLSQGESPIYEPGLEDLLKRNLKAGRLVFTTDLEIPIESSLVIFFALPTPSRDDGSANLDYLFEAVNDIVKWIKGYKILVNKSTVPVGTTAKVRELVKQLTIYPVDVVSNPEFLKEGSAVEDFMKPDRIIIGSDSPQATAILKDLYSPFMRTQDRLLVMKPESAELAKYAANAFLATKVAFINEISRLCEKVGADIWEVRSGLITDLRIGKHFFFPSLGFGGSCFPKDLRALVATAQEVSAPLLITQATIESNHIQKQFIPQKIARRWGDDLGGLKFAVWGLAFKANTDDVRESPALSVIESLIQKGAKVVVYDPQAMDNARKILQDKVQYSNEAMEAIEQADGLVIATEWNEFRHPDFEMMKLKMKQPIIFDGRNLYDAQMMEKLGFEYYGIGTGKPWG